MKLFYKDYIAEADGDRFNLFETVTVTAKKDGKKFKKGDKYEDMKPISYGHTYESLVRKIASLESAKGKDCSLGEYVVIFKRELEKVLQWTSI